LRAPPTILKSMTCISRTSRLRQGTAIMAHQVALLFNRLSIFAHSIQSPLAGRVVRASVDPNRPHQHRATRPTAADLQTEMSQEEGSEMVGPSRASPSDRQPYSS
jgi:hypothetical protein